MKPGSAQTSDAAPPLEIERSFLLSGMPLLPREGVERLRLVQGYLPSAASPPSQRFEAGAPLVEGRLRRIERSDGSTECRHTVKHGSGLVRTELERTISAEEFDLAWPSTAGRRLSKTRFRVRSGDVTWEIDRFDRLDLVLAEVELSSPDASPPPPAWLAPFIVREVTDEPAYRNFEIAMRSVARGHER